MSPWLAGRGGSGAWFSASVSQALLFGAVGVLRQFSRLVLSFVRTLRK